MRGISDGVVHPSSGIMSFISGRRIGPFAKRIRSLALFILRAPTAVPFCSHIRAILNRRVTSHRLYESSVDLYDWDDFFGSNSPQLTN